MVILLMVGCLSISQGYYGQMTKLVFSPAGRSLLYHCVGASVMPGQSLGELPLAFTCAHPFF